jgi:hypothetical protein
MALLMTTRRVGRRVRIAGVAALLLAVCASAQTASRRPGAKLRSAPGAAIVFESTPSTPVGAAATSRDPKLAISSSGAVHLLAAYAEGESLRLGLKISHGAAGVRRIFQLVPMKNTAEAPRPSSAPRRFFRARRRAD